MKIHSLLRYLCYVILSAGLILMIWQGRVFAQTLGNTSNNYNLLANLWMLIAGCLVFFMNAGFAMVEAGFCRTNNATNILAKNLIVFCVSALAYWLIGFGLMFGNTSATGNSFFGQTGFLFDIFFPTDDPYTLINSAFSQFQEVWKGRSLTTLFFFQLTFAGTAAIIVSGAVVERVKFWAFLFFSFGLVSFSYSITGHWIWSSEGWLYNLFKFRDFAGSTVVHSVGGMAGLVGAWLLKPRDGRFGYNRKMDTYEVKERGNFYPYQLGFSTIGCLILWLGWFGFNGGSALQLFNVPNVIATTMMAAASGGILALIFNPLIGRKASLSTIINGILGGLVGITASSGFVNIQSAILIGGISGMIVLLMEELLINLKLDDPVGAIPVHLGCGLWGTIAVGFFSSQDSLEFTAGLRQDSMIAQVFFQLMGWIVVMAFTFLVSLFLWLIVGNFLYYWQQFTLRQQKKQDYLSSVNSPSVINLKDVFSQFWNKGREGIRVSLADELKGSDGVFYD